MKETTAKRARTFAATLCGVALCCGMAAPAMGNLTAYADQASDTVPDALVGDDTSHELTSSAAADVASTSKTFVGWYLYGTSPTLGGLTYMSQTSGKAYGYDKSGDLVELSGLKADFGSHCAYIAADQLDSFLSSSGLRLYNEQVDFPRNEETVIDPYANVVWWALYKESAAAQTLEQDSAATLIESGDQSLEQPEATPEVEKTAEAPATEPAPAQQPSKAADEPAAPAPEEGTLSMQCRESEAAAKIAELEAQGYEIVHVAKAPSWLR